MFKIIGIIEIVVSTILCIYGFANGFPREGIAFALSIFNGIMLIVIGVHGSDINELGDTVKELDSVVKRLEHLRYKEMQKEIENLQFDVKRLQKLRDEYLNKDKKD